MQITFYALRLNGEAHKNYSQFYLRDLMHGIPQS